MVNYEIVIFLFIFLIVHLIHKITIKMCLTLMLYWLRNASINKLYCLNWFIWYQFGYCLHRLDVHNADDIALVAPSLSSLKQMIKNCEQFAESHSRPITFNPSKTNLLCFNMKLESKVPPIYLNGKRVWIVKHEKHLGNYASTDIADRNIIVGVCDLYQRNNLLINDFRVCDSI